MHSKHREDRKCSVEGCNNIGEHTGRKRKDGTIIRRDKCSMHHKIEYSMNGWDYKVFRKDYCENIDGRLGFHCTSKILYPKWQLDADHVNGNPSDNRSENIQTLCKCCHAAKTKLNKDYLSKGRKRKYEEMQKYQLELDL